MTSAKFIKDICIDVSEVYEISDKHIVIPLYDKDGILMWNMSFLQTILKNNIEIGGIRIEDGGIRIEDKIDDIVHIGKIAFYKEEQKKGNGTNVVALLFCLYPAITKIAAIPTDSNYRSLGSIGFWEKLGHHLKNQGVVEIERKDFFNKYNEYIERNGRGY